MDFSNGNKVKHEVYGLGKIVRVEEHILKIDFGNKGVIDISKRNETMLTLVEEEKSNTIENVDFTEVEEALIKILGRYNNLQENVPLGEKWLGGTMVLKPGNDTLKPKEIPIEQFFHKIVMLRDRLRVLEQNINSNTKLNDIEKVNIQQYITRCYGSLTSFNVLFKYPQHQFVGEKSSKE
jgi:hypothetical protein